MLPDIGLRINKDVLQGQFAASQTKVFVDYSSCFCIIGS